MKIITLISIIAQFVGVILLTNGCGGALVSNEQEQQIGADVSQQVDSEYQLVKPSDPVHQWAAQLVKRMVPASADFRDPSEFGGYKVHVVADNKLANAFAVPGGYVYFATGIILQARNCGQLAGVVGHELAHVTERHSAEKLSKSAVATSLAQVVLGEGLPGQIAQATWAFLQNTTFSRKDESEADKVGTQILYKTGYNPHALADFFAALEAEGGPRPPEFLSSHPDPGDRSKEIRSFIQKKYGSAVQRGETQTYNCLGTNQSLAEIQNRIKSGQMALEPAPPATQQSTR